MSLVRADDGLPFFFELLESLRYFRVFSPLHPPLILFFPPLLKNLPLLLSQVGKYDASDFPSRLNDVSVKTRAFFYPHGYLFSRRRSRGVRSALFLLFAEQAFLAISFSPSFPR